MYSCSKTKFQKKYLLKEENSIHSHKNHKRSSSMFRKKYLPEQEYSFKINQLTQDKYSENPLLHRSNISKMSKMIKYNFIHNTNECSFPLISNSNERHRSFSTLHK